MANDSVSTTATILQFPERPAPSSAQKVLNQLRADPRFDVYADGPLLVFLERLMRLLESRPRIAPTDGVL